MLGRLIVFAVEWWDEGLVVCVSWKKKVRRSIGNTEKVKVGRGNVGSGPIVVALVRGLQAA